MKTRCLPGCWTVFCGCFRDEVELRDSGWWQVGDGQSVVLGPA
ncbi:hypothetical protein HMPREF9441_03804 [Paraprevotella clara YIT 11840]|uniref:Uncharacterized protein n=1 Tax=Paraprevotella clara YIT 11840 TaxID=762968 RepID=G5SWN1_9BACT|nr:hypothetical protein HMPREF9441_03804 [Paraprevotella clara YIT 11840]